MIVIKVFQSPNISTQSMFNFAMQFEKKITTTYYRDAQNTIYKILHKQTGLSSSHWIYGFEVKDLNTESVPLLRFHTLKDFKCAVSGDVKY